jgi:hypothetical protein
VPAKQFGKGRLDWMRVRAEVCGKTKEGERRPRAAGALRCWVVARGVGAGINGN